MMSLRPGTRNQQEADNTMWSKTREGHDLQHLQQSDIIDDIITGILLKNYVQRATMLHEPRSLEEPNVNVVVHKSNNKMKEYV